MINNTYHSLLILAICLLLAMLAVSIGLAVHYRSKYLKVVTDYKAKGRKEDSQFCVLDEVSPLIAEREQFLDTLRQKAKEGVEITNDEVRRIEYLEEVFRNEGMEHAVHIHRRTSRVSIAQTYLHFWGLADHEIAVLFNTTRQSVHNNWNRLLKES